MGIFDSIKNQAKAQLQREVRQAADSAVQSIGSGKNRSESFTFSAVPSDLAELKALPKASLDSAFKTAALAVLSLCVYEKDPDIAFEMLNYLKGPEELSSYEKQFIKERLEGKSYKPRSFFKGATPENNYKHSEPYVISVSETPYSFKEDNWATLYVASGGADSPRSVKLRKKPSTGQWFLNELQCLSDIRVPVSEDPWA